MLASNEIENFTDAFFVLICGYSILFCIFVQELWYSPKIHDEMVSVHESGINFIIHLLHHGIRDHSNIT